MRRTQVFGDPEHGRALVETLIRDNRDLGRPDRVRLIVARMVTTRTPGAFSPQGLPPGGMPSMRIPDKHRALTQDLREGRALRTAMMSNTPCDLGCPRGLGLLAAVVALGRAINQRLLPHAEVSQDCCVPLETVRTLAHATVDERGQRAAALRVADARVMALLAAVAHWSHVPAGLSKRSLRQHVAGLRGDPAYSRAQMSYDLRRLRLKGLLQRVPRSQTYVLTALGCKVAHFFTTLYTRLFRPGLAALEPHHPLPCALADALTSVSDVVHALVAEAQLGVPFTP